jgi:hypothetical protein
MAPAWHSRQQLTLPPNLNCRFDHAMSLIILLNCVAMAYERPAIPDDSVEAAVLKYLDVAFVIIFGLEALLKIVAFTFR